MPSRALIAVPLISCLALLVGCGKPDAGGHMEIPPPPVDVAVVPSRSIQPTAELTARIEAQASVEIRARVSGTIDRIAFTEGATVRTGDVLVEIDARPFQAAVERAKAQVAAAKTAHALAQSNLKRSSELRAKDPQAVSQEELDRRSAEVDAAVAAVAGYQAALTSAELDLGYARITAPIDGVVGRADVKAGNLVGVGTPVITTIVKQDPVEVVFALDEAKAIALGALARGASVAVGVGLAGEDGFPHSATLSYLANRIDPATGTLEARALLANAKFAARPGGFARVSVPTGPLADRAVIDEQAVFAMQSMRLVLTVPPGATVAVPRPVQLGQRLGGGMRVVDGGIAPGEQIILQPAFPRVLPGNPIAARPADMDPAVRAAAAAAAQHGHPAMAHPADAPSASSATQAAP